MDSDLLFFRFPQLSSFIFCVALPISSIIRPAASHSPSIASKTLFASFSSIFHAKRFRVPNGGANIERKLVTHNPNRTNCSPFDAFHTFPPHNSPIIARALSFRAVLSNIPPKNVSCSPGTSRSLLLFANIHRIQHQPSVLC